MDMAGAVTTSLLAVEAVLQTARPILRVNPALWTL